MLSYAGIPLLLETEEHREFVNNYHQLARQSDTSNYGYRSGVIAALQPQLPEDGPVRINVLNYPTGVSRCATFHGLVDGARLNQIRAAVGSTANYANLIINDGNSSHGTVTVSMRMLPSKVIHSTGGNDPSKDLYLLTLVDHRFDWRWKATNFYGSTTSWSELYTAFATALDTTIDVEEVPTAYSVPSVRWSNIFLKPLPTLLDSVAMAVGQRIVVNFDGSISTVGWFNANTEAQLLYENIKVTIGGQIASSDIQRTAPEAVTVSFAKVLSDVVQAEPYSATNYLAALAIPVYEGATGVVGTNKVLQADLINDGSNDADCELLAIQMATDWYGWEFTTLDFTAPGIWNWTPTGAEDTIEWHYGDEGKLLTRIVLSPFQEQEVFGVDLPLVSSGEVVPPCKPVWYTEYHHLDGVAVSVGDTLLPGALLGYVADLSPFQGGPHSHFALGDGSDFLNEEDYAVVGQSLDVGDWLPWNSVGTRDPLVPGPLYYPPYFEDATNQEAAVAYIKSCFQTWLPPTNEFVQQFGSSQHFGGEYFAVDVRKTNGSSMAGLPITLAISSPNIESTVIYANEINPDVHSMVIVRHRPCGCGGPWKDTVRVATTVEGDLDTDFVVGAEVDGVELELGDSILIKDQLDATENRIGTVNTFGPPTFRKDADTFFKTIGSTVRVMEGDTNGPSIWTNTIPYFWELVWPAPKFFAKLTDTDGQKWSWIEQVLSPSGSWIDGIGEGEFNAVPSPIDEFPGNFSQQPFLNMRVWMQRSRRLTFTGKHQYEFLTVPTVTVFKIISETGGGIYEGVKQVWNDVFEDTDTEATLFEVNDTTGILADTYVIAFKTPGGVSGSSWMFAAPVSAVKVSCGLQNNDGVLSVKYSDLTGDNTVTGLVVGGDPPVSSEDPCQYVSIDFEVDHNEFETLVNDSFVETTGGTLTFTKVYSVYENSFNPAGLLIDRVLVSGPTTVETEVDICHMVECCNADPLEFSCSWEGGTPPTPCPISCDVSITSTPSGGVPPYTYDWDWGDGTEHSTEQNPDHSYTTCGTFTIIGILTDSCGVSTFCLPGFDGTVTVAGYYTLYLGSDDSSICFPFTTADGGTTVSCGTFTLTKTGATTWELVDSETECIWTSESWNGTGFGDFTSETEGCDPVYFSCNGIKQYSCIADVCVETVDGDFDGITACEEVCNATCADFPDCMLMTVSGNCSPGIPTPLLLNRTGDSWTGGGSTECSPISGWNITINCVSGDLTYSITDDGGTYTGDVTVATVTPLSASIAFTPTEGSCCAGDPITLNLAPCTRYNCESGVCVEAVDGTYETIEACEAACTEEITCGCDTGEPIVGGTDCSSPVLITIGVVYKTDISGASDNWFYFPAAAGSSYRIFFCMDSPPSLLETLAYSATDLSTLCSASPGVGFSFADTVGFTTPISVPGGGIGAVNFPGLQGSCLKFQALPV